METRARGKVIVANTAEAERRAGALDYKRTAFYFRKPYSSFNKDGPFKARNRRDHRALLWAAVKQGCYLYYGYVTTTPEGKSIIAHPLLVDFDSVPDKPGEKPNVAKFEGGDDDDEEKTTATGGLVCEFCGKTCSSTSGLTLHKQKCRKAPQTK